MELTQYIPDDNMTAEEAEYYRQNAIEIEQAEKDIQILHDFHAIHPEIDDMTLAGWLGKRDTSDLATLKRYIDYVSTYIQYELDGRKN